MPSKINNINNWLDDNDARQRERVVPAEPINIELAPPAAFPQVNFEGVFNDYTSSITSQINALSAAITTETVARTAADDLLTAQISSFESAIANLGAASVQSLYTAVAGLGSQYTLKTDVNGYIAGFGLASNLPDEGANSSLTLAPTSTFTVLADKFRIIKTFQSNTFSLGGTVNVENACTVVTGTGTAFAQQLLPNDKLVVAGNQYRITSIANNTYLNILQPYKTATATGLTATAIRDDIDVAGTNTVNVFSIDTTSSPSTLIFNGKLFANDIITGTLNANTTITVKNPSNVNVVTMGKLSSNNYGFEIRDANNKVILTTDGYISANVGVLAANGQSTPLGDLVNNLGITPTNYIGEFSATPDPYSYPINSIYKDTDDQASYINVETSPGVRQWQLFIPSTTSGVSALLTSEAVVLPTYANGGVISYTNANTSLFIYSGVADDTTNWTISKTDSSGIVSTLASNKITVTSLTSNSASITINAARGTTNITKVYNVSKAIPGANGVAGANGSAGLNAKTITLTANTQTFVYASNGSSPSPISAAISATTFNAEGIVYYEYIVNGVSVQNSTVSNYIYSPQANVQAMPQQITVRMREGANNTTVLATDTITMLGLRPGIDGANGVNGTDGANGISGMLTNESITLAANSTGGVSSLAGATGTFLFYDGPSNITGSANITYTVASNTGLTVTIAANGYYAVSSLVANTAYATLRATYKGNNVDKVLSVAKSVAGANGVTPRVVSLNIAQQVISYDATNANPTPNLVLVGAQAFNTSGLVYYDFLVNGVSVQNTTANSYYYTPPESLANMPQQITVRVREGTPTSTILATDQSSFIGVRPGNDGANGVNGADSVSAVLTNEAVTIAANSTGGVVSLAEASGRFLVFSGVNDITGTASVNYSVVPASNVGMTISVNSSGYYTVSSFTADTATATLRAQIPSVGINVDKVIKLAKSRAGNTGAAGANGAPGANGQDAAVITLTRDSIVLPADADGVVSSYAGAAANVVVYKGGANDTFNWTLSKADSVGLTSTLVDNTLTITNLANTADVGFVTITATRAGYATQIKGFTVSKARRGVAGANGANGAAGSPGAAGPRGATTVYVSGRTSWSDAVATSAVSYGGGPILNDVVTQYGGNFSQTRFWNGTSWVVITVAIDGNLLVTGTVGADKLSVSSLSAITGDVGTLTSGLIQSFDGKFVIDLTNKFIRITQ